MEWKRHEYNVAEADFPPAHSFFLMKPRIEQSRVFQFIKRMPKGAVLHAHDLSAANTDFIVKDVAYRDHLWGRITPDSVNLRFSLEAPAADWKLVNELRAAAPSAEAFDARIREAFVICNSNPHVAYPDQASVWHAFDQRFTLIFSTLTFAGVFRDYFWRTLQDYYEDNVMYVEIRGVLPPVFELDGTQYDQMQVAAIYQEVAERFKKVHPDFLGVRLIYAPSRHVSASQVREYLVFFRKLKKALPDFVAGFDLVAHEDDGNPLIDFVPALLQLRQDLPDVKYFFHAGETNWEQSSTDENLVDAVMLNTTRIGHGYAIDKHPMVMEAVKKRGIAIELNPISNQVLNLVQDLRNHPGAALLADDYPLVIGSDDPGLWDAKGLSYDFYEAFLGMAGLKADLRTLKQLAINSIQYSAMGEVEKEEALAALATRWQRFIGEVDRERGTRGARPCSSEHDNSIHSTEA
ncbi:adenosine deaminase 2-like [Thrips palmi]|uniref:Adenosine deaminase n=1 Tax=Thrips palmi TaxID=161013 RepID=A0A6P8YD66_THRPL|nr:adenosine deaminase 2-like [Thrips palmi]